jgi:hypothetical protein
MSGTLVVSSLHRLCETAYANLMFEVLFRSYVEGWILDSYIHYVQLCIDALCVE